MKRIIILLLFAATALCANAQEQERGVYTTDLIREESTGDRFEQKVVITVGRKYLILTLDSGLCGDYSLDGIFNQSKNAVAYIYRTTGKGGTESKIGFEFVKTESGEVIQINIFKTTAGGERLSGRQFLEVRKVL